MIGYVVHTIDGLCLMWLLQYKLRIVKRIKSEAVIDSGW